MDRAAMNEKRDVEKTPNIKRFPVLIREELFRWMSLDDLLVVVALLDSFPLQHNPMGISFIGSRF